MDTVTATLLRDLRLRLNRERADLLDAHCVVDPVTHEPDLATLEEGAKPALRKIDVLVGRINEAMDREEAVRTEQERRRREAGRQLKDRLASK